MKAPIKIVRVIDRLNVGGPAVHVVLASQGLSPGASGGAFETLLVHGQVAPGEQPMDHLLAEHPVRRVFLPTLSRAISPLADLRAFFSLLRLLWREKPQVVHTHKSKAGALGRIAAWLTRVPVRVHTFHGQVFEGYFSGLGSKLVVLTERLLARLCHAILALSPALRDELTGRHRIAPEAKVRLLPLGLDLEPLAHPSEKRRLQRELGLPAKGTAIGIVGRLAPIKNHALFLEAATRVSAQGSEAHFFVVGGGECERALKERARSLGLEERCHFLGFRSDLAEVYASLDAVALCSNNEGTPVALIEALAAGIPVVSTQVGGVADVLSGGEHGRLVPPDDAKALAVALLEVLASPPGEGPRERARRWALAQYSAQRLCENLAALYRELLGC